MSTQNTTAAAPILLKRADYDHHPLLERMAMESAVIGYLQNDDSEGDLESRQAATAALTMDIRDNGVMQRGKAVKGPDGRWLLADGRHRGDACAALDIPLPCDEVNEEQARQIIFSSFILARPRSKGAQAWLMVCMNPDVAGTKKGPKAGVSDSIGNTTREELARMAGLSPDLIDQAAQLWTMTKKAPKLRPQVDAAIAAGKGLGGLIAGLSGAAALPTGDDGKPTRPAPSINGYCRTLKTMGTQLGFFAQWGDVAQAEAVEQTAAILRANESARSLFRDALAAADAPAADD